jgi:hypothetical protein
MAGTTAGRTATGSSVARARTERLATETKHAFKTTEFFAMVAVIAGILISALVIDGGDSGGSDAFVADEAWLYVAIVAVGYMISRGLAKAGSREPYWAGGTNEQRDRDQDRS